MDVTTPPKRSLLAWVLACLIVLGAAVFIVVPAWQLIVPGPFHWHLARDQTWQGGFEAIALIALMAAGFAQGSRIALVMLVALPALFYLRRHAVDVPLAIDAIYIEAVFAIGALGCRLCGAPPSADTQEYLRNFVFGLCLWSVGAWTLSAFGFGSILDLRWFTLALAVIAFAVRPRPFTMHLWKRLRESDRASRTILGALLGWGLVLYARAGLVEAFDSLWYGLRPQYVLVADGSVFRPLGLVSPVHYFPKLYEVFLAPLAALGNSSVMLGIGVWLLLLVGLTCKRILSELGLKPLWCWLGVALAVSVPAVSNMSIEAKPDTLALWLMLMALLEGIRYLRSLDRAHFVWFALCALLATQAKLTAIPYVGVLALALLIASWRQNRIGVDGGNRAELRVAVFALAAAAIVSLFVIARTWLLAGVPTIGPDPLLAIWRAFGMDLTPPAGTLHWTYPQEWSDVPALLIDELFRPERLPHIVITWLGNAWLCLAIVAIVARFAKRSPETLRERAIWLGAAMMLTGLALLVGWRYMERGSDGNYFAIAAVTAAIFSLNAARRRIEAWPNAQRALAASVCAFALFQAAYAFVSGSWTSGTRAFDTVLTRGLQPEHKETWLAFEKAGIAEIADRLREGEGVRRAVGYVEDGIGFRLPLRYEDLMMVGYSRPEYLSNMPLFLAFLRDNRIDALILPRAGAASAALFNARWMLPVAPEIEALPGVRRFDDRNYTLYDFSASPLLAPREPPR